jgi:hypothetical protein
MSAVHYLVPAELIHDHLRPQAYSELVQLMLRGAQPEPLVMVRILNGAWVARYAFKEAIRTADGVVSCFQATLRIHPEGTLG